MTNKDVQQAAGNLLKGLPDASVDERFEPLLQNPQLRIERIVSQGQSSAKDFWYDQDEDEWIVLIQGAARIELQEPQHLVELKAGDYFLLPAHCKHRVDWTEPAQDTIWLAVFMPATCK